MCVRVRVCESIVKRFTRMNEKENSLDFVRFYAVLRILYFMNNMNLSSTVAVVYAAESSWGILCGWVCVLCKNDNSNSKGSTEGRWKKWGEKKCTPCTGKNTRWWKKWWHNMHKKANRAYSHRHYTSMSLLLCVRFFFCILSVSLFLFYDINMYFKEFSQSSIWYAVWSITSFECHCENRKCSTKQTHARHVHTHDWNFRFVRLACRRKTLSSMACKWIEWANEQTIE